MLTPVILSGGAGTRLWPVSRSSHPKQLARLTGELSLLQQTVQRAVAITDAGAPIVVCNTAHVTQVKAQLAEIGAEASALIVEPVGRNTAPAAAAAALLAGSSATLLVLPADHLVADTEAFASSASIAASIAEDDHLVTFGVVPDRPHTGYGYIRPGSPHGAAAFAISEFTEKPDREEAEALVTAGALWNSGMFVFGAETYLDELATHRADIVEHVTRAIEQADTTDGTTVLEEGAFQASPSDSIDYAVMEHTGRGVVVPLDAGWNDIGSWAALWEVAGKDADGNTTTGAAYLDGVRNSLVRAADRPVAVVGLDDVIVVDDGDSVLVVARSHAEQVKGIVEQMAADERPEIEGRTD